MNGRSHISLLTCVVRSKFDQLASETRLNELEWDEMRSRSRSKGKVKPNNHWIDINSPI